VWGCDIIVDWADPQEEPDEGTMSKVKVLYVRNLTHDISEEKLKVSVDENDDLGSLVVRTGETMRGKRQKSKILHYQFLRLRILLSNKTKSIGIIQKFQKFHYHLARKLSKRLIFDIFR
jgi:hypothetical protein